jgi:hypothetical protein
MAEICKYAEKCIVFKKGIPESDQPKYLIHNVFCKRGFKGWEACKRFEMYKMNIEPTDAILPGNDEPVEILAKKS